ncbi:MAG: hypothetical protein XU15_C0009G0006 [candidate division NC10 bacterium CSP1-5]|nr:MAG: hypothetical protein XU15_C0009G0006 [candidate division NC10 bacterium CSP1-5]
MTEFVTSCSFYFWAGVVSSIFFGVFSPRIFVYEKLYEEKKAWKHAPWWIYQFFFNGTGAFIGWMVLYYLSKVPLQDFETRHFVGIVIAFIGVTGNLPYVVMMGRLPKDFTK